MTVTITKSLLVGLGGAAGSMCRYWLGAAMGRWTTVSLPAGTLAVNLLGSFAIGLAVAWLTSRGESALRWQAIAVTGFLGGFTTYSAFALETVTLLRGHQLTHAVMYVAATLVLAGAACFAGHAIGKMWLTT